MEKLRISNCQGHEAKDSGMEPEFELSSWPWGWVGCTEGPFFCLHSSSCFSCPLCKPSIQSVPSFRKPSLIDDDGDASVLNGAGPQVSPATRVDRVRLSALLSFRDESKTIARGMERGYTIFSVFFSQHFHTGALRIK